MRLKTVHHSSQTKINIRLELVVSAIENYFDTFYSANEKNFRVVESNEYNGNSIDIKFFIQIFNLIFALSLHCWNYF